MRDEGKLLRLWSAARRLRFEVWLVAIAALALAIKLWLAAVTYGTNDVYAYERFASWSRYLGSGLYAAAWDFNHPPSMMPVLRALDDVAQATGVSFAFWLRLLPSLADGVTLWLVYRLAPQPQRWRVRGGLLLLAASPVLLLISGFHGNTDSVVMALLMASVYWTDRTRRDGLSGVAFGLAMCIKIVPVVALPVLLLARGRWRERGVFAASALATLAVCWLPWMLPDFEQALAQVFGYRSLYGGWGPSWIATRLFGAGALPNVVFARLGGPSSVALAALAALLFSRQRQPASAYAALAVVFGLLLATGSAFGVQYLAWLAPWIVGLPLPAVAFFSIAAGGFLLVTYNYWAGGFPWYLADSNVVGSYVGHADHFHLLAWSSVVVVLVAAVARARGSLGRSSPLGTPRFRLGRPAVLACGGALLASCAFQVRKDSVATGGTAPQEARVSSLLAAQHIELSSRLLRAGRSDEGMQVARRALQLAPTQPVAWNNLSAGHASKAEWDAAIEAAEHALALAPRFALARSNLRWAREQKQQRVASGVP